MREQEEAKKKKELENMGLKLDKFNYELEEELLWRQEEINYLKRNLQHEIKETDQNRIIKMLIVMLYSHYEGFIKFMMLLYINKINSEKLTIGQTNNSRIKAAALENVFCSYENIDKKSDVFRKEEESHIHVFSRRTEFIEKIDCFQEQKLLLKDEVINTESNLNYKVLSKNLYKIGINYTEFKKFGVTINELINLRNAIAHGESKTIKINLSRYQTIEKEIYRVIGDSIILFRNNYKEFLSDLK